MYVYVCVYIYIYMYMYVYVWCVYVCVFVYIICPQIAISFNSSYRESYKTYSCLCITA